jgi:hypothetical protein
MTIQQILERYRENAMQLQLLQAETGFIDISAQVLSDMPKGSGVSSPVENAAEQIKYRQAEIAQTVAQLTLEIKQAEIYMDSKILSDFERFVLRQRYVENKKWHQIRNDFIKEFEEYPAVKTLDWYRWESIRKLNKVINKKTPT